MDLIVIMLWASAGWLTFGALATIGQVGRERKPVTSGVAIGVVVSTTILVATLIAAATRLA